jgi:SAM-dependent methyltransferase
MIRPSGFDIIEQAALTASLKAGKAVLDVGCGEGESLSWLRERFGVCGVGIDKSEEMIRRGKERDATLDLRVGEADFLEFPSRSFDAVLMECVLSLVERQTEALHEAWCVLKPGGVLILSDLCFRPKQAAESGAEQELLAADGIFHVDALIRACETLGFTCLMRQDKSKELDAFVAEKIFEYGSLQAYFAAILPEGEDPACYCKADMQSRKPGYFLLVMEKEE